MTPYYEDDACTIIHADCLEILPTLPLADLVLTDPPYGTVDNWQGSKSHGWGNRANQTADREGWDVTPTTDELASVIAAGLSAVVWGGNYFDLAPSRCWLVWNKVIRNFTLAEAELAWTNVDANVRVFDYMRNQDIRDRKGVFQRALHPTQKPLPLMRWCLELFPHAQTILDPYMGSGTTLRAAKDCGRRAIGIEQNERYCEIAAKRLAQEVLAL